MVLAPGEVDEDSIDEPTGQFGDDVAALYESHEWPGPARDGAHLALLRRAGGQIAVALANLALRERLEQQSVLGGGGWIGADPASRHRVVRREARWARPARGGEQRRIILRSREPRRVSGDRARGEDPTVSRVRKPTDDRDQAGCFGHEKSIDVSPVTVPRAV